ncbi:MAG TPA: NAD(P)-binding domain-containing protein [Polyangia bacterium]
MSAPAGAAVIGGGLFGRALARRLAQSGPILLHNPGPAVPAAPGEPPMPELVRASGDLGEAARCPVLFLAIPAAVARPVCRRLGEHVAGDQILVHTARGLEPETGRTVTAIVEEETCLRKLAVLGGALRAESLDAGRWVAAVVASRFDEVTARATALLGGPTFRVLPARDVPGVELCGAYRSICALGIGVTDALDLGPTVRALVITEALREASAIAARLGADPLTLTGYAGLGDLVATAVNPAGVEREAGARLAAGAAGAAELAPEAAAAVHGALVLARGLGVEAPVAASLGRLLDEGGSAEGVLRELFAPGGGT